MTGENQLQRLWTKIHLQITYTIHTTGLLFILVNEYIFVKCGGTKLAPDFEGLL